MEKKKNFQPPLSATHSLPCPCRCKRKQQHRKNSQKQTQLKAPKQAKPHYSTQQTCPSENEQSPGSTHYTQWLRNSQAGSSIPNPVPYWKEMSRQLASMSVELDEENVRLCSAIQKYQKKSPQPKKEGKKVGLMQAISQQAAMIRMLSSTLTL